MVAAGGSLGILIPPSIMPRHDADQGPCPRQLLMPACCQGFTLGILYMIYIGVRCKMKSKSRSAIREKNWNRFPMTVRIVDSLKYAPPPSGPDLPWCWCDLLRYCPPLRRPPESARPLRFS